MSEQTNLWTRGQRASIAGVLVAGAVIAVITLLVGLGYVRGGFLDHTSRVLTFIGLIVGSGSALLGIVTEFRSEETKAVTPWGWVAVTGVLVGFLTSASNIVLEFRQSQDARIAAARETESLLHDTYFALYSVNGPLLSLRFDVEDLIPTGYQDRLLAEPKQFGIDAVQMRSGHYANSCAENFPDFGISALSHLRTALESSRLLVGLANETGKNAVAALRERRPDSSRLMDQALEAHNSGFVRTLVTPSLRSHRVACRNGVFSSYFKVGFNADDDIALFYQKLPSLEHWKPSPRYRTLSVKEDNPLYLIVMSTLFHDFDGVNLFSDRWLKRARLEVPGLGIYCGDRTENEGNSTFGRDQDVLVIPLSKDCR